VSDVIRFYQIRYPLTEDEEKNFYAELRRPEPGARVHFIDMPANSVRYPFVRVSWLVEGPHPDE
jgi:hypothetical protein